MRLGAILGQSQEAIYERIERAERREMDKKRAREIAKKRRLGKTIRYNKGDA